MKVYVHSRTQRYIASDSCSSSIIGKKSDLKENFKKTGAITICRGDAAVREREVPQAEVVQGAMLGIL